MIDFACRNFEIEDVIKCSLSLSKAEFKLFNFFIKNSDKDFSSDDLSKSLGLDKSTVQRGLKKLHEKDLLFRKQFNQSVGGYVFRYRIKNKNSVKEKVLEILDSWNKKVENEIKKW